MNEHLVPRPTSGASERELAAELRATRARTAALTEDLSAVQLMGPMLPTVNPILWEVGHVGWFHEYWTLRNAHGERPLIDRADLLWNSSTVPHDTRWELDLPDRHGVLGYMRAVLARQLDRLDGKVDVPARYFYELSIRHEDMHVEALAYSRQTLGYPPPVIPPPERGAHLQRDVRSVRPERLTPEIEPSAIDVPLAGGPTGDAAVPGGIWQLGSTPDNGFVFDNEKWAHEVELAPFHIAKVPVTNRAFAAFVEEGGYTRREFWSGQGWAWREGSGAQRPCYWVAKDGEHWLARRHDGIEPLAPEAPVTFVNWYEAQAWCMWAKRRLPTEAEWEAAALGEANASGSAIASRKRRWPWGNASPAPEHANLDFASTGPIDVAACSAGDSAFGCRQMIGNAWEWTASDFVPFAGFAADPYADYSAPWFNTRKVLRGGSYATSTRIARALYRNFFTPERNDVIASFRTCAL